MNAESRPEAAPETLMRETGSVAHASDVRFASRLLEWRDRVLSRDSELRPACRLTACALAKHMSRDGNSCFPGVDLLAAETGLARRTVQRALRDLERAGWIDTDRGGGRSWTSEYEAVFPEERASQGRPIEDEKERRCDAVLATTDPKGVRDDAERASLSTGKGVTVTPEDAHRGRPEEDDPLATAADADGRARVTDMLEQAAPASVPGGPGERRPRAGLASPHVTVFSEHGTAGVGLADVKAAGERGTRRAVGYLQALIAGAPPESLHGIAAAVAELETALVAARDLARRETAA